MIITVTGFIPINRVVYYDGGYQTVYPWNRFYYTKPFYRRNIIHTINKNKNTTFQGYSNTYRR